MGRSGFQSWKNVSLSGRSCSSMWIALVAVCRLPVAVEAWTPLVRFDFWASFVLPGISGPEIDCRLRHRIASGLTKLRASDNIRHEGSVSERWKIGTYVARALRLEKDCGRLQRDAVQSGIFFLGIVGVMFARSFYFVTSWRVGSVYSEVSRGFSSGKDDTLSGRGMFRHSFGMRRTFCSGALTWVRRRGRAAYVDFEEAQTYARSLGLHRATQWKTWAASGLRPAFIPKRPHLFYMDDGFTSYQDFLGLAPRVHHTVEARELLMQARDDLINRVAKVDDSIQFYSLPWGCQADLAMRVPIRCSNQSGSVQYAHTWTMLRIKTTVQDPPVFSKLAGNPGLGILCVATSTGRTFMLDGDKLTVQNVEILPGGKYAATEVLDDSTLVAGLRDWWRSLPQYPLSWVLENLVGSDSSFRLQYALVNQLIKSVYEPCGFFQPHDVRFALTFPPVAFVSDFRVLHHVATPVKEQPGVIYVNLRQQIDKSTYALTPSVKFDVLLVLEREGSKLVRVFVLSRAEIRGKKTLKISTRSSDPGSVSAARLAASIDLRTVDPTHVSVKFLRLVRAAAQKNNDMVLGY